jgi:hypothetical protein
VRAGESPPSPAARWAQLIAGSACEHEDGPGKADHLLVAPSTEVISQHRASHVRDLSTMRLEGPQSPFCSVGSIRSLNSGASAGSVVDVHTAT